MTPPTEQLSIGSFRILTANSDVAPYVERVQKNADSERNAFGFLNPNAYRQAAAQGKLFVAIDNDEQLVAHLMFGGVYPFGKVFQIYCIPEFRMSGIASALMETLIDHFSKLGFLSVSARVASDLDAANTFYGRLGFSHIKTVPGGQTKKRWINIRVRELNTPSLFSLFENNDDEVQNNLMIPSSFDAEDRIYAIDLNVFFDVGKRRSNEKDAGKVIAAVMRGDIKGVITQEFVEELERSTGNFRHDPFLALAQRLRVLPAPKKATSLANIESQLATSIFPHRSGTSELSPQEQSDVRHLSIAIHHKIDGFITSDQAILRSQAKLRELYGLDLLAPSDFSDDADITSKSGGIYEFQDESFSQLFLEPLSSENLDSVMQFLAEQGENDAAAKLKLDPSNPLKEQNTLLVWSGKRLIAFSCWRLSKSSLRSADIRLNSHECRGTPLRYPTNGCCK